MPLQIAITLSVLFGIMAAAAIHAESSELSFHQVKTEDMKSFEGRQIYIRGFLYETENGALILAGEPNLKSCCVGSHHNVANQITIQGDLQPSVLAVTVEGTFKITESGYTLEHVKLLSKEKSTPNMLWITLGGIGTALIGYGFYRRT